MAKEKAVLTPPRRKKKLTTKELIKALNVFCKATGLDGPEIFESFEIRCGGNPDSLKITWVTSSLFGLRPSQ